MKIHEKINVSWLEMTTMEDSWEGGCDPSTLRTVFVRQNFGLFDSPGAVLTAIYNACGVSDDPDDWHTHTDDDGTRLSIETTMMVDEDGGVVETDDPLFEDFKQGKVKLWLADVQANIEYVTARVPTEKEAMEDFGMKSYNG